MQKSLDFLTYANAQHGQFVAKRKVKHLVAESVNFYERRLMREIEAVEARIAELTQEKYALQRQLQKARWENHSLRDVNRKNSANRVMVEERVLSLLHGAEKPLHNSKLLSAAKLANFDLNPSTFRTYLRRLKEKGLIENTRRGYWKLTTEAAKRRDDSS